MKYFLVMLIGVNLAYSQSRYILEGIESPQEIKQRQERKKQCLTGKTFYKNGYSYPKYRKISLRPLVLAGCVTKMYQDRGGSMLTLSEEIKQAKSEYTHVLKYLLGSEVNYFTDNEMLLRDWVLEQADNSITPAKIIEKSLELNENNLIQAILTIHQTLKEDARFYQQNTFYTSTRAMKSQFFNKFVDIRGDLEERCDGISGGDHSGTWYRIWGTMFHGLTMLDPDLFNWSSFNTLKGLVISNGAELLKVVQKGWKEIDNRKAAINNWGYDTAFSIPSQFLFHGSKSCDLKNYLR